MNAIETNITTFTNLLASSGINYQNGLVAFRDVAYCDSYSPNPDIATYPLTPNNATFISYVSAQTAGGGYDFPESSLEGIQAAVTATDYCGEPTVPMAWRPGASHTIILITDAGTHSLEYDGLSTLSIFTFPESLYANGFTIDGITNNCGVPNPACTDSGLACTNCNPVSIVTETGGTWLSLTSSDWSSFMTALGTSVVNLTNVLIQDPLPPGLGPVPGGSAGESISGNNVYFNIPNISMTTSPTPVQVCFPVTVNSLIGSYISNTAAVAANGVSAVSSNVVSIFNYGPSPTVTVTGTPTLSPTITPSPTITLTLTVTLTPTPTLTPSQTFTPTWTATFTPTSTPTWTGNMKAIPPPGLN